MPDSIRPLRVTLRRDEVRGLALLANASVDSAENEDDAAWWESIARKLDRALDR